MAARNELLRTSGLNVAIGGRSLCRGIDLRITTGECWGLLGPNGAGKTTLLQTLIGLHPAAGGEILLAGEPLARLGRRAIARRAGLLFQHADDPFPATVLETVVAGRHPHKGPLEWDRDADLACARAALARLGIERLAGRAVDRLSGGERQLVALAQLLTQDPPLLLLDEPTDALDLGQAMRVLGLVRGLCGDGRGALIAIHDLQLALRFCDRLLLLTDRGVVAGSTDALDLEAELGRLYRHPLARIEGPAGPLLVPR